MLSCAFVWTVVMHLQADHWTVRAGMNRVSARDCRGAACLLAVRVLSFWRGTQMSECAYRVFLFLKKSERYHGMDGGCAI
jgi:hypothetical protein